MEHNENMNHEVDAAPVKKARANKVLIAIIIVVLTAGVYVYFKGNPFTSGDAVIPQGMPEALREVTSNAPVAKVNGKKIDRTTYNNMLASVGQMAEQQGVDLTDAEIAKSVKQAALTNVINNTLLRQAAKNSGSVGSDEVVEEQIQSVIAQLGGEEAYTTALESLNVTDKRYRETIKGQVALSEYIEATLKISEIVITDDEIKERYDEFVAVSGENAKTLPKLDEAKEEIRESLIRERQDIIVAEHIETLRTEADIEEILTF